MAKNWAAYGNVSKKSVPKTKQVTEHRYPVDPQKLAHDTAQLDFETKREKRKGTQLGLETAKFIKTGTPSFGGLLKPLLIGFRNYIYYSRAVSRNNISIIKLFKSNNNIMGWRITCINTIHQEEVRK